MGLLSTSLEGLEFSFKAILSLKPWLSDPAVAPIPWREDELQSIRDRVDTKGRPTGKPLKIGLYWRDPSMEPHPPVRRGMKIVADALRKAGHTIVEWQPPDHSVGVRIHQAFIYADGAADVQAHIKKSGEPILPEHGSRFEPRDPMPLLDYQDLTIKGLEFENQYSDYWNSTALDDGMRAITALVFRRGLQPADGLARSSR